MTRADFSSGAEQLSEGGRQHPTPHPRPMHRGTRSAEVLGCWGLKIHAQKGGEEAHVPNDSFRRLQADRVPEWMVIQIIPVPKNKETRGWNK